MGNKDFWQLRLPDLPDLPDMPESDKPDGLTFACGAAYLGEAAGFRWGLPKAIEVVSPRNLQYITVNERPRRAASGCIDSGQRLRGRVSQSIASLRFHWESMGSYPAGFQEGTRNINQFCRHHSCVLP